MELSADEKYVQEIALLRAENERLRRTVDVQDRLLGSHADGRRCTCTMVDPGVYHGDNMHPPEWEQDPWCPTHPDADYIRHLYEKAEAKLAEAWDEGHRHPQRRGPDDCQCGAYYVGECACGEYGCGPLLSLADNPYRK